MLNVFYFVDNIDLIRLWQVSIFLETCLLSGGGVDPPPHLEFPDICNQTNCVCWQALEAIISQFGPLIPKNDFHALFGNSKDQVRILKFKFLVH